MKKILLCFILCLTFTLSATSCYVGNGWQDTPEKALAIAADSNLDTLQRLTPINLLDKFHINERTYMLFVSKGDTLVQASFVTNKEGQYHYEGDTEEIAIDRENRRNPSRARIVPRDQGRHRRGT